MNILWLPGTLCDGRLFGPQKARFGEHQTARVDQFDSVTSQAHAIWRACEADRVALVGLSYGGILALEMARQHPERVSHMAILDANARNDTLEKQRARNALLLEAFESDFEGLVIEKLKPLYLSPSHDDDRTLELIRDMAMRFGPDVLARQVKAVRDRPDQRPHLPRMDWPSLVLAGDDDTLCPRDRQAEMAQALPNARWLQIPECGHLSTLEKPEIVNQALADLFAQH